MGQEASDPEHTPVCTQQRGFSRPHGAGGQDSTQCHMKGHAALHAQHRLEAPDILVLPV